MKKLVIIISFLLFLVSFLYSDGLSGKEFIDEVWMGFNDDGFDQRGVQRLIFSESTFKYKEWLLDGSINEIDFSYEIKSINDINFLIAEDGSGMSLKWLVLFSEEILILYDNDGYPFFFGSNIKKPFQLHFAHMFPGDEEYVIASSYLSEVINGKEITYSPSDIQRAEIPNPWVEGVPNNGIGEYFDFYLGDFNRRHQLCRVFHFSNGYVSYERPDLYLANNRIKRIRITQPRNDASIIIDMDDTPNMQKIYLDKEFDGEWLRFEILDIYQGDRYDDTCLNFVFYYDDLFEENGPGK